jgi:hypothetical protein
MCVPTIRSEKFSIVVSREGGIDMVPSGKEPMVLAETDGKKENSEKAKIMNCFMTYS